MSTVRDLFVETPHIVAPLREAADREQIRYSTVATTSVREDQIQALVQQLFFGNQSSPVRHVGFAPVEASTATAELCLEVAKVLAEEDQYDIGLIDAHSDTVPLQTHLQVEPPNLPLTTWPMGPRLWLVPRQSWLADSRGRRITDQNLLRLRELTAQFDFSILWCAPVSWLTASIGQSCDGMVLVLSANKTRCLVAARIKEQFRKAQVRLLGTVLAERRFPVPQGLYQNL